MRTILFPLMLVVAIVACDPANRQTSHPASLQGTWQLVSATIVQNGDTTIIRYGTAQSMIKIINGTHFAFLNHDVGNGKDSARLFVAGGGRYTLKGNEYTEFLDYCSDREWEGHQFEFTVSVDNDTLMQTGIEKATDIGVERQNTEKYVRVR